MKECADILESVKVSGYSSDGILYLYYDHTVTKYMVEHDFLPAYTLFCLLKLYSEAGTLYEKCQNWDRAAAVYTKVKNW